MKSYLFITGALGGLGSAFVLEAAKKGFDLFLTDLSPKGDDLAAVLADKYNIEILYRPCDLSDEKARTAFLTGLKEEGFAFWGLINVAGLDQEGGFLERTASQILKILTINLISNVEITHAVLFLRDPDKKFRLINVCSLAGFFPMPYKATYAASKRYLLDFSRALGEEIKPFGSVTALCPAGMPTTEECMRSIFAQGFWGLATSMHPSDVARRTLNAALRGRRVVIPGLLNQLIHSLSSLVPAGLAVQYIARRWKVARGSIAESSWAREPHIQAGFNKGT